MAEPNPTAIALMKMALALLDCDQDRTVAPLLQHAIDIAENAPRLAPGDELPPALIDRYLDLRR